MVKYISRTNEWNKHRGILLVPDLGLLLSANPQLAEGFSRAKEITVVIRDNHSQVGLISFKVRSLGTGKVMRSVI